MSPKKFRDRFYQLVKSAFIALDKQVEIGKNYSFKSICLLVMRTGPLWIGQVHGPTPGLPKYLTALQKPVLDRSIRPGPPLDRLDYLYYIVETQIRLQYSGVETLILKNV